MGVVDAFDDDLLVERLVDEPPTELVGCHVWQLALIHQFERDLQRDHNVLDVGNRGLTPAVSLRALGLDSLLLGLQDLNRDGLLVMELNQLLLLAVEFPELATMPVGLFLGHQRLGLGVVAHSLGDGFLLLLRQNHAAIHALDRHLGRLDRDVGCLAASAPANPRQAAEVLIHPTAGSLVAPVAEPTATGAVQRPLQVVAVLMGAVAAGPVGRQDVLDSLEDLPVDDRLMDALPLGFLERDNPDVEVVAQHPVDHRAVHRFARLFGRGPIPEPGVFQDVDHLRDGVVASRKQLEGHLDKLLAVGIKHHHGYLAVADDLTSVHVADGCWSHVAASQELAFKTGLDLDRIASGAEGVDPGHDGVEQLASRAVIDALQRRLQLGPMLFDLRQQPKRIEVVAGQPRQVVDDDVGGFELG